MSPTVILLTVLGHIATAIAVVVVARRSKTMLRAILWGIATATAVSSALMFVAGFLSYLVPVGQLDFFLANLLRRMGLI